jgi:hypothetical protein
MNSAPIVVVMAAVFDEDAAVEAQSAGEKQKQANHPQRPPKSRFPGHMVSLVHA